MTVHWRSAKWIDVQLDYLRRNIEGSYRVWAALNDIDEPGAAEKFHFAEDLQGTHAEKLNELARIVIEKSDPSDVLMFLDGDAFPVTPLDSWVSDVLSSYKLVAVRRNENLGDCQPHPCFCITTAGFWQDLGGDWRPGGTWLDSFGEERTDVGGILLYQLKDKGTPWLPLVRSNTYNRHPVWFGVYDHRIYHHGAGFRNLRRSRADADPTATTGPLTGLTLGQLIHSVRRRPRRLRNLRPSLVYAATKKTMTLRSEAQYEGSLFARLAVDPLFYREFDATGDRPSAR
jgi:hypothetical protein